MGFPPLKDQSPILRLMVNPKLILSVLALLNVLAVPQRFGGLCFYNWRDEFYLACTILVAAVALLTAKWWGYLGALFLSGTLVYNFIYLFLKVFGFIALSPSDPEGILTPEIWLKIARHHPEEWLQVALAAAIFMCAAIYFVKDGFRRRRLFV